MILYIFGSFCLVVGMTALVISLPFIAVYTEKINK